MVYPCSGAYVRGEKGKESLIKCLNGAAVCPAY